MSIEPRRDVSFNASSPNAIPHSKDKQKNSKKNLDQLDQSVSSRAKTLLQASSSAQKIEAKSSNKSIKVQKSASVASITNSMKALSTSNNNHASTSANTISRINYQSEPSEFLLEKKHHDDRGIWRLTTTSEGLVVSGSYDHHVGVWNLDDLKCQLFVRAHQNEVLCVKPNPAEKDGFITTSSDGSVKFWSQGQPTPSKLIHRCGVYSLAILSNGNIASGPKDCRNVKDAQRWDYNIRIYNSVGKFQNTLEGHEGAVSELIELDDEHLVSSSADHTVKIWNTVQKKCIKTYSHHKDYVYHVVNLGNGMIATASRDKKVSIINTKTDEISFLEGHESTVYAVAKISDNLIASASRDCFVAIWDIDTKKCIKLLDHGSYVYSVTVGKKGEIVAGLASGEIIVWKFSNSN